MDDPFGNALLSEVCHLVHVHMVLHQQWPLLPSGQGGQLLTDRGTRGRRDAIWVLEMTNGNTILSHTTKDTEDGG